MYNISDYSYKQAEKLGVDIKPSTRKGKKIDVFKAGEKIASIGSIGYKDFPQYLKEDKALANKKRKAYKKRHEADRNIKGTAGYYADKILW